MTTVKGMFAAGDASGASSHKFSSGSHAEGRICAKSAIGYIVDHPEAPKVDAAMVDKLKAEILKPLETFAKFKGVMTDPDVNPNYIRPKQFMYRFHTCSGGLYARFRSCSDRSTVTLRRPAVTRTIPTSL